MNAELMYQTVRLRMDELLAEAEAERLAQAALCSDPGQKRRWPGVGRPGFGLWKEQTRPWGDGGRPLPGRPV